MERPISLGLKWVIGMSVMSKRMVPSLNVDTLFLRLSIPFSTASVVLVLDMSTSRLLSSAGGLSPICSQAALNSASRSMSISAGPFPPKLLATGT